MFRALDWLCEAKVDILTSATLSAGILVKKERHKQIYEVRDSVHGFVTLTDEEWAVVDCPVFQRMRDIRQLGLGHLVYPGANHTRFEHSLGCVHVASHIFDHLCDVQGTSGRPTLADAFGVDDHAVARGRKILRLASLLHDLGHPPFSHTGELFLPDSNGRALSHEEMTALLIRESEIAEAINDHFENDGITVEEVIAAATKPGLAEKTQISRAWLVFLNELVTGQLGADRIDFLLRDAHHSGQASGRFDHEKLIQELTLVARPIEALTNEPGPVDFSLGIGEEGWLIAEQMMVARYLMYISLYFHETKRIYELHLCDFLSKWLQMTWESPRWPADPKKYAGLTDSHVLAALTDAARDASHPAHRSAEPFFHRTHMRLAREVVLADNYKLVNTKTGLKRFPDGDRFAKLEKYVNIKLGKAAPVKFDQLNRSAIDWNDDILVSSDRGPLHLDHLSELVAGMATRIWRGRVYAPCDQEERVRKVVNEFLDANPIRKDGRRCSAPGRRRGPGSRRRSTR